MLKLDNCEVLFLYILRYQTFLQNRELFFEFINPDLRKLSFDCRALGCYVLGGLVSLTEATLKATIVESVPLLRLRLDEKEVEQQIDVDLWCGEQKEATFLLVSEGKVWYATHACHILIIMGGGAANRYTIKLTRQQSDSRYNRGWRNNV